MAQTRLAFLWHMHQPLYREPETGEYLMPWVRLHATRAYYDMAWMLERHPKVKCTVNFTPVLLEQLDDYARGVARDRFQELSARPAEELHPEERQQLLKSFFMVDWETVIRPLPRYWDLLQKRGRDIRYLDLQKTAERFTAAELTDLQVLFNLGWMGFGALADDEGLRALRDKGGDFGRADVDYLLAAQRRIVGEIAPRWRRLAERGQVELSSTPYHHPILPLVCDTDSARRALPGLLLPQRFAWPEDARWHVREAIALHERTFGAKPAGMWPAEGSVSPEALEVFSSEGVGWLCSDETVLFRSLAPDQPRLETLYRPWVVEAGGGRTVRMLFRDRGLSDLIGFTYARTPAKEAVADFVGHLETIGMAWTEAELEGPATVGVFLDGENPWEHFPASGFDFLEQLYRKLEESTVIETATLSEATAAAPGPAIPRIHSGSWIEGSYRIWIGHQEDRQAWTALAKTREALAQTKDVPPEKLERARHHLYAAEGSDWYWWYGEDFTTELAAEFDSLFRGHLIAASHLLGVTPPPEALEPIKRCGPSATTELKPLREPTLLLSPRLDGQETTYFEWQGAGLYRPGQHRGSMFGGAQAFNVLHFGFDLAHLYLRLDPAESAGRAREVATTVRLELVCDGRQERVEFALPEGGPFAGHWREGELGEAAFVRILELAVPFAALRFAPRAKVALAVHVLRGELVVERLPRYGYLNIEVPDEDFERIHWRV